MLKMMQNNPTMMQSMMTGMMETFKKWHPNNVLYGLNHYDEPSDGIKYIKTGMEIWVWRLNNRNGSNYKTK
jgi:hypothetical protein